MRIGHGLVSLFVGLSLAACASAPVDGAAEDAKFVWGCWVSKDTPGGPPVAFLRLLPDGSNYSGPITNVRGGKWDVLTHYAFARDGSQVIVTPPGGAATTFLRTHDVTQPEPETPVRLTYSDGRQQLDVRGGNDTLHFMQRDGQLHIWGFERDGCD